MQSAEFRELAEMMLSVDDFWPIPLTQNEAISCVNGHSFVITTGNSQLVHLILKTNAGLGTEAILPGGYKFSCESNAFHIDGRLEHDDANVFFWRINRGARTLAMAISSKQAVDDAITLGMLFMAVVSTAAAADINELAVLARMDSPNAIAALGHSFGSQIRTITPASDWRVGYGIR